MELGAVVLLLSMATAGVAAGHGAAISGVVWDSKGVPQMGAMVQVLSPDATVLATTFTDLQGRYSVGSLLPGLYGVRASAALFLPTLHADLRLQAARHAVVNLTLTGLGEAAGGLPVRAKGPDERSDDWNWTLRSSAGRPILKLGDDISLAALAGPESQKTPAIVHLRAGVSTPSRSFGNGCARVNLRVERARPNRSMLAFESSVANPGAKALSSEAPIRISSSVERQMGLGGTIASKATYESHPEITLLDGQGALKVVTLASAERFALGDFAEVEVGSRVQALPGAATAIITRPFLQVAAHPTSTWTVTYSLARAADSQDFESAMWGDAALPATKMVAGSLVTDKGMHQEVGLAHKTRTTVVAFAVHDDALDRIAVSGRLSSSGGSYIPFEAIAVEEAGLRVDQSNGAFQALSTGYHDAGVNLLLTQTVGKGTWIAFQYCTGAGMVSAHPGVATATAGDLPPLQARRGQAVSVSVRASVAKTGTKLRGGYRWQPKDLVTQVAPYDVLGGGGYLSVHVRQPLRRQGFLPEGLELTIDGTNMLAQGYQGFVGPGSRPLYLASSPSNLQAGLAFSF